MATRRDPRPIAATYAVAIMAFAGTAGLLASRVQAGADPAIGAGPAASAPGPQPRIVVTRRIHRTTIITTRVRRAPVAAVASSSASSGPGPAAPSSVGTASPAAPAPAATAAAPAPAPAPAVSAPVTRAS